MYRFTHIQVRTYTLRRNITPSSASSLKQADSCSESPRCPYEVHTHGHTPSAHDDLVDRAEPGKLGHALCSFRAHKVRGQGANGWQQWRRGPVDVG